MSTFVPPQPTSTPHRSLKAVFFLLPVMSTLLLMPSFYLLLLKHTHYTLLAPTLNTAVITLLFNSTIDIPSVEHNCVLLHAQRAGYYIYTDNVNASHCELCDCVPFHPLNCPCPRPEARACNHCEKLHFLIARLHELNEFVFLDSDVVILKEQFLARLLARARVHDMLASRGHTKPDLRRYYGHFNSGVMFLRRVDGVNYGEMIQMMYEGRRNQDQGVVSEFVFKHYRNWDRLSLKWHCRGLGKEGYDIPPGDCYTFHDRQESTRVFREMGFKLRKVNQTDYRSRASNE